MRRQVGRAVLAVLRYRIVGEPPEAPAYVLVAAPHTSWLDLPLMLGIAWSSGIVPGFLAKKELFRPPFGAMLRGVGAIQVDREDPGTLVADLAARCEQRTFALVIAPGATRGRARLEDRLPDRGRPTPMVLGFVDGPTRTGGFGPTIRPSGDLAADMETICAYYADKHGVVPDRASPVVVRSEPVEGAPGPTAG
jgi:1-acyl-sn-glycerol-3-phosphate acyltransferase